MGDTKRGRERKGRDKRAQTEQRLIQRDLDRYQNGTASDDLLDVDAEDEALPVDDEIGEISPSVLEIGNGIPIEFETGNVLSTDADLDT